MPWCKQWDRRRETAQEILRLLEHAGESLVSSLEAKVIYSDIASERAKELLLLEYFTRKRYAFLNAVPYFNASYRHIWYGFDSEQNERVQIARIWRETIAKLKARHRNMDKHAQHNLKFFEGAPDKPMLSGSESHGLTDTEMEEP